MSERGGVIHIGSFSKSIAPALRVGYIVAPWDMLSRMLALKTDGWHRRPGADGAGRVLRQSFHRPCPAARARLAAQGSKP